MSGILRDSLIFDVVLGYVVSIRFQTSHHLSAGFFSIFDRASIAHRQRASTCGKLKELKQSITNDHIDFLRLEGSLSKRGVGAKKHRRLNTTTWRDIMYIQYTCADIFYDCQSPSFCDFASIADLPILFFPPTTSTNIIKQ
jgi:hypothetical protein